MAEADKTTRVAEDEAASKNLERLAQRYWRLWAAELAPALSAGRRAAPAEGGWSRMTGRTETGG